MRVGQAGARGGVPRTDFADRIHNCALRQTRELPASSRRAAGLGQPGGAAAEDRSPPRADLALRPGALQDAQDCATSVRLLERRLRSGQARPERVVLAAAAICAISASCAELQSRVARQFPVQELGDPPRRQAAQRAGAGLHQRAGVAAQGLRGLIRPLH